jgi:hypothetical protein
LHYFSFSFLYSSFFPSFPSWWSIASKVAIFFSSCYGESQHPRNINFC